MSVSTEFEKTAVKIETYSAPKSRHDRSPCIYYANLIYQIGDDLNCKLFQLFVMQPNSFEKGL